MEINKEGTGRKSFALICRGDPSDFQWLIDQAKIAGLFVVYSKSSSQKLIIEEVSW